MRQKENSLLLGWLESLTIFGPSSDTASYKGLDGRELGPSDVLGHTHYPLLRLVSIPSGDAANEDALNGAAIEYFEDLRAQAKSFQLLRGRGVFMPSSRLCWCVWTMMNL